MFLDRLLRLLVFAVSVAESDVSTDVALAIDLAATGSHQYIALFGNVLNCVPPISIKFASCNMRRGWHEGDDLPAEVGGV